MARFDACSASCQHSLKYFWFSFDSNSSILVMIRHTSRLPVGSVPFVCVRSVGPLSLALDFLSVCCWCPRAHSQSETGFLSVDSAQRFADKQFTRQVIWVIWYFITSISILREFTVISLILQCLLVSGLRFLLLRSLALPAVGPAAEFWLCITSIHTINQTGVEHHTILLYTATEHLVISCHSRST